MTNMQHKWCLPTPMISPAPLMPLVQILTLVSGVRDVVPVCNVGAASSFIMRSSGVSSTHCTQGCLLRNSNAAGMVASCTINRTTLGVAV